MKRYIFNISLFVYLIPFVCGSDAPLKHHRGEGLSVVPARAQVYSIPTYDAAFKWVLSDERIRQSFFNAFVPNLKITQSERLDEHMNPLEKLQLLRDFLHKNETQDIVKGLSSSSAYVAKPSEGEKPPLKDEQATAFLHEMVGRFEEIKGSFPPQRYDGTMDFACRLENGEYALVEMQVIPHDYWDRRALAYVAAFYGNQLSRGGHWKDLKKVIGINILGGGKDRKVHWSETPTEFHRHFRLQDQLNSKSHTIDGIEIIQYSIMNAPETMSDREKQDWIMFFKDASYMTEKDVKDKIQTPEVKEAFERARIQKLPEDVKKAYQAEDDRYDQYSKHTAALVKKALEEQNDQYSKHTADLVQKGRTEGVTEEKIRMAKALIDEGINDAIIVKTTGLTLEQFQEIGKDFKETKGKKGK